MEILALAAAAAAGWFVWDSLAAREAANQAMRRACADAALLFLDDTVALRSVWPVRDDLGRLVLRRVYAFEVSDTGHDRRRGTLALIGRRVDALDLGTAPASDTATLH